MSLFRPMTGNRIALEDGSEVDPSAIWDIHILVVEHNDCVFLRLSDAHADDQLALLYTNAIGPGRDIVLSTNPPAVGSDWQPLQRSHFQFGVAADCLRLCKQRLTDLPGCTTILGREIRELSKVGGIPMPVLAKDSNHRLQAYVPGSRRSNTPRRTIDAPGASHGSGSGGPNGLGTIQQGLNGLAAKVHTAAAHAAANPGAMPPAMASALQGLSAGLTTTPLPGGAPQPKTPRTRARSKPAAPAGPIASPFKPSSSQAGAQPGARPAFKSPLKSWF